MDAMARSMQGASVPFGVLDPQLLDFRFCNAALDQQLRQHSVNSGTPLALVRQQLKPSIERCIATRSEQVHEWPATGTRLVLVPVLEGDAVTDIQCFAQQDQGVQNQRLEDTLNSLSVGVWLAKPDGQIFWVNRFNPSFRPDCDMEAYLRSSEWLENVHPDDIPVCAESFAKAMVKGKVDPFEMRTRAADGRMRSYLVDGYPVQNADGSIDRWAGVTVDIQHFKEKQARYQLEIERLKTLLEAETARAQSIHADLSRMQKMDLLGQLAGNVAHDFNNLLFVIRLNASMLKRHTADVQIQSYADLILQDVKRASHTASELMTFSGRQPQAPATYAVASLMADMQVLLQSAIGAEAEFSLTLAPELPPIRVDKTYFENALINLAVNARDAVAGKGRVQISVSQQRLNRSGQEQNFVQITVADNGTGMSAEVQSRILEPFYTTKEVGKGTGLGLSVVDGFVRQAGGFLEIDSELGRGTAMSLFLPESAQAVDMLEEEAMQTVGGTERILVIEDDLHVRNAVARLLMETGYIVSTAYSPEAALHYVRKGLQPDLILSDIRMPGPITVLEMVQTLEAEGLMPPILFMTGYAADVIVAEGLVEGRYPVIQKPVSEEELSMKVRAVLDGGKGRL